MKIIILAILVSAATAWAGLTFKYRCGWCGLTLTSNMAVKTVCPSDGRVMYAMPVDPRKP
jgi:hypothetical protein